MRTKSKIMNCPRVSRTSDIQDNTIPSRHTNKFTVYVYRRIKDIISMLMLAKRFMNCMPRDKMPHWQNATLKKIVILSTSAKNV